MLVPFDRTKLTTKAEQDHKLLAAKRHEVDAKVVELLKESDKYLLPDYPAEKVPANITEYRQALRDINHQVGYPTDVVWPEYNNN